MRRRVESRRKEDDGIAGDLHTQVPGGPDCGDVHHILQRLSCGRPEVELAIRAESANGQAERELQCVRLDYGTDAGSNGHDWCVVLKTVYLNTERCGGHSTHQNCLKLFVYNRAPVEFKIIEIV